MIKFDCLEFANREDGGLGIKVFYDSTENAECLRHVNLTRAQLDELLGMLGFSVTDPGLPAGDVLGDSSGSELMGATGEDDKE